MSATRRLVALASVEQAAQWAAEAAALEADTDRIPLHEAITEPLTPRRRRVELWAIFLAVACLMAAVWWGYAIAGGLGLL